MTASNASIVEDPIMVDVEFNLDKNKLKKSTTWLTTGKKIPDPKNPRKSNYEYILDDNGNKKVKSEDKLIKLYKKCFTKNVGCSCLKLKMAKFGPCSQKFITKIIVKKAKSFCLGTYSVNETRGNCEKFWLGYYPI